MKKYSKRGGSPAYELLKQEGFMSAINPVDSSKPLTYVQSGNVSHLIETSGGGRKRVAKKSRSRRSRSRSRVSKRTTRNTRRRTRVSRKRSKK
jgi:hypothetical protein